MGALQKGRAGDEEVNGEQEQGVAYVVFEGDLFRLDLPPSAVSDQQSEAEDFQNITRDAALRGLFTEQREREE